MSTGLRVSLVQMQVGDNKSENLERAERLIKQAAEENPDVIVLPEYFSLAGTKRVLMENAEDMNGETITRISNLAVKYGVHIVAGTLRIKNQDEDWLRNTCCLIKPDGSVTATYEKIHPFTANVGGTKYGDQRVELPGNEIVTTSINGITVGLTVCFDMRFPEVIRIQALRGAKVIIVPAMFTLHTGKDHWEVLLRARAIENQLYMVAAATYGTRPPNDAWTYGRSMIVDPWGIVVAQASDIETVVTSTLDFEWMEEVRKRLPAIECRRPEVYQWPE